MFSRFAHWASHQAGRAYAFVGAMVVILLWGVSGPLFGFSDTWQLVINTSTTIITFLMVFLIQNTQNRDSEAVQLKLDELIRAMRSADNSILDIENLSEQDLRHLQDHYARLAQIAEKKLTKNNKQESIQ